jgi:integrase
MNALFDLYEAECIPQLQWRSQRDYRGILVILRREFGDDEARDVKPRKVYNFINVPKGRVHRNRMVTILSTVFIKAMGRWCLDEDLTNPCTVVERWPTRPRDRYVTNEEFETFRATTCPQVQIAMDLALLIGQRQGDIVGMKWSQVKTENIPRDKWHIAIDQGKTRKKLAIFISKAVEDVLDRAWLMEPHWPREYVIRTNPKFGEKGLRYTEDGFRAMWQRYMRAWAAAGNPRFHYHDLRAKCISDNKDFDAAYLLSGHIDPKMTRGTYDRSRREVQPLR